jgi:3-oxoacid CoA-transferase subunit A
VMESDFIDPNIIVTPGIFIQRLVRATPREKEIEQRTVRARISADSPLTDSPLTGSK